MAKMMPGGGDDKLDLDILNTPAENSAQIEDLGGALLDPTKTEAHKKKLEDEMLADLAEIETPEKVGEGVSGKEGEVGAGG